MNDKVLDVHLVGLTVSLDEFEKNLKKLLDVVAGKIYLYYSNSDLVALYYSVFLEISDPVCLNQLLYEKLAIFYLNQCQNDTVPDLGMILQFVKKKLVICDIGSLTQSSMIMKGYQTNADRILQKSDKDLVDPEEESSSSSNSPTKKSLIKKIVSLNFS